MVHAADLGHLSIIGRYAYGLACVEALCAAWAVDDPFILGEIHAHWQAAEIRWSCTWFDDHPLPRHVGAFAAELLPGSLSADRAQSLHHALHETRMVMCKSCYAAASDTDSMQSVLNVVGVLARWGVALPRLDRFRHAAWSGEFGWGERLGRETFSGERGTPGAVPE